VRWECQSTGGLRSDMLLFSGCLHLLYGWWLRLESLARLVALLMGRFTDDHPQRQQQQLGWMRHRPTLLFMAILAVDRHL
jgi:hypothetical protein